MFFAKLVKVLALNVLLAMKLNKIGLFLVILINVYANTATMILKLKKILVKDFAKNVILHVKIAIMKVNLPALIVLI